MFLGYVSWKRFRGKSMHNISDSDSFHCQGHYIIKWHFQHVSNAFQNDDDEDDDDVMMMMMMNCFCGMVDRRNEFSLISSRNLYQRSSPSQISDMP